MNRIIKYYSFTLVELMIVLAILASLTAITMFAIKPSAIIDQVYDQRRVSDVTNISRAIDYLNTVASGNLSLGTATTVYTSLPDNTSATCASYALPTLPTGYSYACKNSTVYKMNDSTGWIPINFRESDNTNLLSSLPIDPVNDINYYYTYNPGGSYEINAFFKTNKYIDDYGSKDGGDSMNAYEKGSNLLDMPLTFPHNWIKVPGNSLYGTSDFWVMQFEAKYTTNGKSASDANIGCRNTPLQESIDSWNWNKAEECTSTIPTWNYSNIISSPMGSVIGGIDHNEAKAACAGIGAHLITNPEWMTIARNADQIGANWTSGTKGVGYLFNGNSGDNNRGYDWYDNLDKGVNRNVRAILTLSNGSKIYDFAGNAWEFIQKDSIDTLINSPQPIVINNGALKYSEFTELVSYGDFSANELKPTDPTWNSSNGVGKIFHYDGAAPPNLVIVRGGSCSDGYKTGAFAMALQAEITLSGATAGFRCAR